MRVCVSVCERCARLQEYRFSRSVSQAEPDRKARNQYNRSINRRSHITWYADDVLQFFFWFNSLTETQKVACMFHPTGEVSAAWGWLGRIHAFSSDSCCLCSWRAEQILFMPALEEQAACCLTASITVSSHLFKDTKKKRQKSWWETGATQRKTSVTLWFYCVVAFFLSPQSRIESSTKRNW